MDEQKNRVAKYLREFEYEFRGRKFYVTVIRRFKNRYTGDVYQYVKIEYDDGDVILDIIDDDAYEMMMRHIVKN